MRLRPLSVIAVLLLVAMSALAADAPHPAKVYVCPMPQHSEEFTKPGSCPICGMDLVEKDKQLRVAVLVFENVEEIDYTAPYEVFGQAGARVFTVSTSTSVLNSVFGLRVQPEFDLEHAPASDVVLIPGGGVGDMVKNEKVIEWLKNRAASSKYVLSVCNGAFIVAKAGLLDGLTATTTAGRIEELARFAPKTHVVRERFVDNGKVITTAGLSAGIDGALHVIEREYGRMRAEQVARGMEYHWQPDVKWTRSAYADMALPNLSGPPDAKGEIIASGGDTEQWEVRGRHATTMSPDDLLDYWAKQIVEQGWKVSDRGKGRRTFTRTDLEGRSWTTTFIAEPGDAPSMVVETVTIRRVSRK